MFKWDTFFVTIQKSDEMAQHSKQRLWMKQITLFIFVTYLHVSAYLLAIIILIFINYLEECYLCYYSFVRFI
jgi:hypothetical protein